MARIRCVKPEMALNERINSVSIPAVLTFVWLMTQADDEGRHLDNNRIIHGEVWCMRDGVTPADVADHLDELSGAGLICRYTGCDKKKYLHLVGWDEHQKISHPTASRYAACALHDTLRVCAKCKAPHPAPTATAAPAHAAQQALSTQAPTAEPVFEPVATQTALPHPPPEQVEEIAGQGQSPESLRRAPEPLRPGSRILDPGSVPKGGGFAAPAADTLAGTVVNRLVAWYVKGCPQPPSRKVRARLGKEIKDLLAEGIPEEQVLAGLEVYRANPKSPALLPYMVDEAVNGRVWQQRAAQQPKKTTHQGWTNPTRPDAYADALRPRSADVAAYRGAFRPRPERTATQVPALAGAR